MQVFVFKFGSSDILSRRAFLRRVRNKQEWINVSLVNILLFCYDYSSIYMLDALDCMGNA